MRVHLRLLSTAGLVLASLHADRAEAAGAVIGHGGAGTSISGARTAVAVAPGRMTRWMQLTVGQSEGGFLWLVPAATGARIDLASDAWLDALDDATAPTILPPDGAPPCDAGLAAQTISRGLRPPSASPVAAAVAADAPTLAALVAAGGATLTPVEAASFDAVFASGIEVVVLDYDTQSPAATTRTIQIVEPAVRSLDLPAAASATPFVDTTVFVLAGARVSVGATSLTLDPGTVQWGAAGVSNFASAGEQVLDAAAGEAWLIDSAMPDRLFQSVPVPGAVALPSVVPRYFALAQAEGDASLDADGCSASAASLAAVSAPVAPLCPAGMLITVPGPSPCSATAPGDASSAPLVCGANLTDAAFALAGLQPAAVWLTRASGLLLAAAGQEPPVSVMPGAPVPPVVTASGFESSCHGAVDASFDAPLDASADVSVHPGPGAVGGGGTPSPAPPPSAPALAPSAVAKTATAAADVANAAVGAASDGCDGSSSDDSEDSDGSGCDSSSSSSDDSSADCSGSSEDSSPDCAVTQAGRPRRGVGMRLLFLGVLVLAVGRRARRARRRPSHR